jgi:hypothetical protein
MCYSTFTASNKGPDKTREKTMEKLPALIGALVGGLTALACVAFIADAVTAREIAGGAAVLAVLIFGLIIIGRD